MAAYNDKTEDELGRQITPIVANTSADGSGTKTVPITDTDGHPQVDVLSITASTTRIGKVMSDVNEVRVAKAIDASIGAYTAGDVVNDDDCCTTATAWTFAGMAAAAGGSGAIYDVEIFNETRNQAVQYEIFVYNAIPTGELMDNSASNHPLPADMAKWVGSILMPFSVARGAAVATTTKSRAGTPPGESSLFYKCATGSTSLYIVLVTRTAYTQVATNDITIILHRELF